MDGPVSGSKVGERLNDSKGPRAGTRTGRRGVNELPDAAAAVAGKSQMGRLHTPARLSSFLF
jgi:hypothetical protein